MAYATVSQVEAGFRTLTSAEQTKCSALLDEAAIIIDAYNANASDEAKRLVSCRLVRRVIGDSDNQVAPMGSTQGSMTAGPYTQSWTLSSGSAGEMYLGKLEKKLLGVGNQIGSYSPVEGLVISND